MSANLAKIAADALIDAMHREDGAAYIIHDDVNDVTRIDVFVNLPRVMADVLAVVRAAQITNNQEG
jgi:hypothetical protein